MQHQLPPLPYEINALEPHISRETLQFHYGKHHKAYVDNLNRLIEDTEFENAELEAIVRRGSGGIFNNAAQVWNHTFFWHSMSPAGGGRPPSQLLRPIEAVFGSFDAFKDKFSAAAVAVFGSGWAWLVKHADGSVGIETTANALNPLASKDRALLTLDVWEHAYYIDYRNRRADFVEAFWNVVNWDFAARNYAA